jgi:hypothetical protein
MQDLRSSLAVFAANTVLATLFTVVYLCIDPRQPGWWSWEALSPMNVIPRVVTIAATLTFLQWRRQKAKH